ncbi:LptA/OstA family protein [Sphingomonas sp.]|uniref:LptA/OstA family protein n=1 Tax=Sphingomonas sp. TaxID=28214 RepID=UPI0025D3DA10|nr:LptA/OstA family protein [Sphingomonas sp.]
MRPLFALGMIVGAALSAALPAGAQALKNHNTDAPVDFAADRIEVQDKANRAVFSGNVHATQGNMILDAARMTVAYTNQKSAGNPSVQRVDASGGVTVHSPDQTARGNFGIYDLNRRIITLLGAVTLIQGSNTVRGGRLVIDLNSGRSVMDGSAVAGAAGTTTSAGGRVTGRFTVPERK